MQINTKKASNPVMFIFIGGLGLGVAYGVVRSFNLSLVSQILSFCVIVLIMWLLFRQGKASAYSSAQAWARSEANAVADAYAHAISKAEAYSEAYAQAISQANATAINNVTLQIPLPDSAIIPISNESVSDIVEIQQIEHSGIYSDVLEGVKIERPDVFSPSLATGNDERRVQLHP
jgi:hypothetical protein